MNSFKIALLACLITLIFAPQSAIAAKKGREITKAKAIVDDVTAREKGLTVSTKRMRVGVPAGAIDGAFELKIKKMPKRLHFRTKKRMIGPSLKLHIKRKGRQGMLPSPVNVAIKYRSKKKKREKHVAYYARTEKKWKPLDTRIDAKKKTAYARVYYPYVRLSVLEKRQSEKKPKKEEDYADFGYGLDSASAVVIDPGSGAVLYGKNKDEKRSIASLTKIMTAQVFLDSGKGMDDPFTYSSSCDRECVCLYVNDGETMKVRDLFYTALVGSANNAAVALARSTGYSDRDFVNKMNEKARSWGLERTSFVEPSGLDQHNESTAHEYAELAERALREMDILKGSTTRYYQFWTMNTGHWHGIQNQNRLLNTDLYVLGTKTGFTYEAMFCLMVKARQGDEEVIVVVLGNPSYADSSQEVYDLAKWAFENYDW